MGRFGHCNLGPLSCFVFTLNNPGVSLQVLVGIRSALTPCQEMKRWAA